MLVAVVPLRDLATGKSRLRAVLPDAWRRALILALAEGVITALRNAAVAERIVVISPDPELRAFARSLGGTGLPQASHGLIGGLWEATNWAKDHGATQLLTVHADLPCLTGEAVRALVQALPSTRPAVVIAGDRQRHGTNALLSTPPGAIPYRFGEASFGRHHASAVDRGVTSVLFSRGELAFDLDTPGDLHDLARDWPAVAARLSAVARRHAPTFPADLAACVSSYEVSS